MKLTTGLLTALLLVTVMLIIGFNRISQAANIHPKLPPQTKGQIPATIREIPLPPGFTRMAAQPGSFAEWLRNFKLRKNNTVYLYNGQPAQNQHWHYAVLNLSTGDKDLQQCADAIMRLRAEYYFAMGEYEKIVFGEGKEQYKFNYHTENMEAIGDLHKMLMLYLQDVFINCGTYTVDAMSTSLPIASMQPGDMFVHAGSPGHAMIVVDVATNAAGKKIYMLAQSYMPAQDMHIVVNGGNAALSPWYEVDANAEVVTPGYTFEPGQLKRWKLQ